MSKRDKMRLTKRPDGWWIINIPDLVAEVGPYNTKAEAEDDMRGLDRTFRLLDASLRTQYLLKNVFTHSKSWCGSD